MLRRLLLSLFFVTICGFAAAAVQAQATRTWVSGVGDDVNPCSRTAPCKTFAGAISKTAAGGEINCLDPGGFGSLTVTKSLTVDCRGTIGSTLASATTGFVINIPSNDPINTFRLRGVNINGAGTTPGVNGLRIVSGSNVYIEDVVIDGFSKAGVSVENAAGDARVAIYRSSIRTNSENGVLAGPKDKATASVVVVDSLISGNGTGLTATAGGAVTVSRSAITFNKTGVAATGGGRIMSSRDNTFAGNGSDGKPAAAPLQ